MSVSAMILRQGTLASLYRPTWQSNDDGSREIASYTLLASKVPVSLENVTTEGVGKVQGVQDVTTTKGFMLLAVSVARDDRVLITAGDYAGQQFRVLEVHQHRRNSPNDHAVVMLEDVSTETIA